MDSRRAQLNLRLMSALVSDYRHLVDDHVVTFLGVMDADFAILADPLGLNLFSLGINISDTRAELISHRLAGAGIQNDHGARSKFGDFAHVFGRGICRGSRGG